MNRGFAALVIVLSVTGILISLVAASSLQSVVFFDQVMRKEYRLMNYYNAYNCLDRAILNIAHNYFYTISEVTSISDLDCSILLIESSGDRRTIYARGDYMKAYVYRKATIRLQTHNLLVEEII